MCTEESKCYNTSTVRFLGMAYPKSTACNFFIHFKKQVFPDLQFYLVKFY